MISSEGYKAFRGTMRIVPKNPDMKPYELTGDWLYKPEYQCWYGRGSSFPEEICEVVVDLTEPSGDTPLTPGELREMVGQWAWVVIKYEHTSCDGWAFIPSPAYIAYLDQMIPITSCGEKFSAYRCKPEEATR